MRKVNIVRSLFILALASPLIATGHHGDGLLAPCDGLPRVNLETLNGLCIGLVAEKLNFPRGILALSSGDLLVVTMGGWELGQGAVIRLSRIGARYQQRVLLGGLDRPHGIAQGPDGKIYIGVVSGIIRFDPNRSEVVPETVVGGNSKWTALPGTGRHPLINFVFGGDRNLYVTVGSASDNCEGSDGALPDPRALCAEAEGDDPRGSIRRYRMQWPEGVVLGSEIHVRGLRNSMALAVDPRTGGIYQGENSRDAIHVRIDGMTNDNDLPHDELNRIESGKTYGWPYCYDLGIPSPEYPGFECQSTQKPVVLLPAHSAPLGMLFYSGNVLPGNYQGALLIAFHGYRSNGHRIVSYVLDVSGRIDKGPDNLVWGWRRSKKHGAGAPTSLAVGGDGAIYVTEDRNGTILRIAKDK